MDKLSIKVQILDRMYPLTIERKDEERIRKAAIEINKKIDVFKQQFSYRDKQDLLSMCILQLASENLKLASTTDVDVVESSLLELERFLDSKLNESDT